MILTTFRLAALTAALGGLAVPALAATTTSAEQQVRQAPRADSALRADSSRRVELPFLLDFRPAPDSPSGIRPRRKPEPHPFRALEPEQPLRASAEMGKSLGRRLSPRVAVG